MAPWVLLSEFMAKTDSGGHADDSRASTSTGLRRQQGSEKPGNAVPELGIGPEQRAMLPVKLPGKPGDFLAHGRGQVWNGSAALFPLPLGRALAPFGFGLDLGVKLGEPNIAVLRLTDSREGIIATHLSTISSTFPLPRFY